MLILCSVLKSIAENFQNTHFHELFDDVLYHQNQKMYHSYNIQCVVI